MSLKFETKHNNENKKCMAPLKDSHATFCSQRVSLSKRAVCAVSCFMLVVPIAGCSSQERRIEDQNSTRVVVSVVNECGPADESDAGNWNGQEITVADIEACESREEFLELVMPVYQFYCNKYGIKWPGVMALQCIYETGVPDNIAASLRDNNNMGGLKYSSSMPNCVGKGSISSEGDNYAKFNSVDDYIEAAIWNVAEGSYYSKAMSATTMEDFATYLIRVWVNGNDSGGDAYAPHVINDYKKYNLSKYEGNTYTGRSTTTTASAVGESSGEVVGEDNAAKIWNYLKTQGFTDEQVAGIMGNFQRESGFEPTIVQGGGHADNITVDGVTGYGIAQWTSQGRQQGLADYAASKNKNSGDLTIQLEYFIKEFSESYDMEEYKKMTDDSIDDLTLWFHNKYEVSADTADMIQDRIDYAYEIYERFKGTADVVSNEDECADESAYDSADIGDGEKYHLAQQNDSNCGAACFTMAVNMLLGDPEAYDDLEVWKAMGSDTTTIGWASGNDKAANWLKSEGLNSKIEVTEVQTINDRETLISHLRNGEMCIVSSACNEGDDGVFLLNNGTKRWSGGHYILFYGYRNGEFYVNDPARQAELGAAVKYTDADVDAFFNSPGRNDGGSVSIKMK